MDIEVEDTAVEPEVAGLAVESVEGYIRVEEVGLEDKSDNTPEREELVGGIPSAFHVKPTVLGPRIGLDFLEKVGSLSSFHVTHFLA